MPFSEFNPCLCHSVVSLFGILIGSSSTLIFGEYIWSPLALMEAFLDKFPSHATRTGVAFISICFIVAQLGYVSCSLMIHGASQLNENHINSTNVAANSISAGCDLTSLFPRFITIRRGGYICALVGVVMCPCENSFFLLSKATF